MTDTLTVLVSPGGIADGVVSGLADLTAAGLVDEFVWARYTPGTPITEVTVVDSGTSRGVTLQRFVSDRRVGALRLCLLTPATSDSQPIDVLGEVAAAQALVSATGAADVVRLQCLLVGSDGAPSHVESLVIEGWHNIVVAPEDSRGPGFGRIATPERPGIADTARYAAPVVAGLTGLWTGVDETGLDGEYILPGSVVRLARTYYRRLRTDEVETRLRSEILAQDGNLPIPTDLHVQVVPVQDPALAASTMAQALWRANPGVLKGPRMPYEAHAAEKIGAWAAIKMFFGFLWASLKNAPASWYRGLVDNISGRIAISVQNAVFTDAPAAYEVVVRGRHADGTRAGWADIGAATEQLSGLIGRPDLIQHAGDDLGGLWQDYTGGAFTLADAGSRGAGKGLNPIPVGAARGVVTSSSSIVPGPRERFVISNGGVAAAVRTGSVDATDPLGIGDLRARLTELQSSPDLGLQAGSTLGELNSWASRNAPSYGSAVGSALASAFTEALSEFQHLLERFRTAVTPPDPGEGRLTLARWTQVLVLAWLVLSGVYIWLGASDRVRWWIPVLVVLGSLVVLLVSLCIAFIRSQRQLFALLHQRRKVLSDRAVDDQNLQSAFADLRRLSQAYGQFLSWSRAVGSFLESPLGPDGHTTSTPLAVSWGMPMSTAVGVAQPSDESIDRTAADLRRDLYHPSWLTEPWEDFIAATGTLLPGADRSAGRSTLWRDRGAGTSSGLDRWSSDVYFGRVTSTGADRVWDEALTLLNTRRTDLIGGLVGTVQVVGGQAQPINEFLAGLDRAATPSGSFSGDVLTDVARSSGVGEVLVDRRSPTRTGIGIVCVATQLSDGFTIDRIKHAGGAQQSSWSAAPIQAPDNGWTSTSSDDQDKPSEFRTPGLSDGFTF
ncbi:hypothetical protein SAMN04488550_0251 [Gordonia malaquae]|uniref:Uncharacterized protein n=1 Tax=Gordonia malaquae NBRC 108250 TaxID=1223542 RepID=M3VBJ8_GORML|nr:hypothetical protein [Gordonia malaquae]GAC80388.1 hypothetical protein GM1_017_00460 [Gordonia malaquae NBRC 108250]SEB52451.1 hypothetical protein SAMN04488550_0251 [Gordonia malaquae]